LKLGLMKLRRAAPMLRLLGLGGPGGFRSGGTEAGSDLRKLGFGLSAAAAEASRPAQPEKPQHRGGPPQFHQSEFQMRLSHQDQLATAIRLAKTKREAQAAAEELIEKYRHLPPDQAVLLKVLTLNNETLLEKALDELLELDGRGKVRQTPELLAAVRGVRSKSRTVRELVDLLLEKLGVGRR
ncbi:MAG: hypothetical protein AAFZ18_17065, partial [Myxococcota bacterium]